MVHQIQKELRKLLPKQQETIKNIIKNIVEDHLENLDVKKLVGTENVYRIRVGSMRIIFRKEEKENIILFVERRSDTTYEK